MMPVRGENFLGIDWGKRDVGVALAHGETRVAVPLTTELNDSKLFDRLAAHITSEDVGTVIIGVPTYVNREMVKYPGEVLGQELGDRLGIQVFYQNEMFTTKLAQMTLIAHGEKNVSQKDDAEAARIILQEWLDQNLHRATDGEDMVQ